MRHGSNSRRSRGRNGGGNNTGNNGNRRTNSKTQTYDSNGPDVRIRGNAFQITEKYMTLARDAASAGDATLAEGYYQHAEHYQRLINVAEAEDQKSKTQDTSQKATQKSSSNNVSDKSGATPEKGTQKKTDKPPMQNRVAKSISLDTSETDTKIKAVADKPAKKAVVKKETAKKQAATKAPIEKTEDKKPVEKKVARKKIVKAKTAESVDA